MTIRLADRIFANLDELVADVCATYDCTEAEAPTVVGENGAGRSPIFEAVHQHREELRDQQRELVGQVEQHSRPPLASENRRLDAVDLEFLRAGEFMDKALTVAEREKAREASMDRQRKPFNPIIRGGEVDDQTELGRPRNPLEVTAPMLDAVQHAFNNRISGLFDADMVLVNGEEHAALTTTTLGAPRDWGSNILSAPRTLWETAGVVSARAGAPVAQFPKLTLPAVDAGVGEGVTLVEFAASTGGTVTLKRYGRYTDFTMESLVGADAGAVLAAHRTAIARDLDSALIGLVNTDAGSAVAFTADVPAAIRKAIALIGDATAAPDGRMVVLAHPDNVALLQAVTSTGGVTIGEDFPRFAGALVYASSAVPTGFMLVANLASACRFWSSGPGVQTQTFQDVKTGVLSAGTQIFAGFGTGAISGYVSKVDVVTP